MGKTIDLSKLKEADLPKRTEGMSDSEWILQWLFQRRHGKAYKAALQILTSCEVSPLPLLVKAAAAEDREIKEVLRLLDVIIDISEIGEVPGPRERALLTLLQDHPRRIVKNRVDRLFRTLYPAGLPPREPADALELYLLRGKQLGKKIQKLFGQPPRGDDPQSD